MIAAVGLFLLAVGTLPFKELWLFDTVDPSGLFMGFVSLAVAVIALGLADPRPHRFRGKVTVHRSGSPTADDRRWKVTFTIYNDSKHPMEDMRARFLFPKSIGPEPDDQQYFKHTQKRTMVYMTSTPNFLGVGEYDSRWTYEFVLDLDKWTEYMNIYVTVSANGHIPLTLKWKSDEKSYITDKNNKEPGSLKTASKN